MLDKFISDWWSGQVHSVIILIFSHMPFSSSINSSDALAEAMM